MSFVGRHRLPLVANYSYEMSFIFKHGDILGYISFKLLLAKTLNTCYFTKKRKVLENTKEGERPEDFGWFLACSVDDDYILPFYLILPLKTKNKKPNKPKPRSMA